MRQKSFSDLHKLWYVLLKEKNLLYSQKEILRSLSSPMVQPHRIFAVSSPQNQREMEGQWGWLWVLEDAIANRSVGAFGIARGELTVRVGSRKRDVMDPFCKCGFYL